MEAHTGALAAMVVCLVVAGAGITHNIYFALRQRMPDAIPANTYEQRIRISGLVSLGSIIVYLTLATAFNVWPGISDRSGSRQGKGVTASTREIELPVATSVLIVFSTGVGLASGAMSSHYFRRLGADLRSQARARTQFFHILLASLPLAPLFCAAFAFMFWLSRVSDIRFGALMDDPPRWLLPVLLAWLIAAFTLGDLMVRTVSRKPRSQR